MFRAVDTDEDAWHLLLLYRFVYAFDARLGGGPCSEAYILQPRAVGPTRQGRRSVRSRPWRKARRLGTLCSRYAALRAGILHVMDPNDSSLERLSREQCMRLLGSVPVGRERPYFMKIPPTIVNGRRIGVGQRLADKR
jgi:hypothetical protein